MNPFLEWLRGVRRAMIAINFNAPVTLNFFSLRGKLGKGRPIPKLLATAQPQAPRQTLVIRLAPGQRDRLLMQPTNPNIRASWQAVAAEIERQQKRI